MTDATPTPAAPAEDPGELPDDPHERDQDVELPMAKVVLSTPGVSVSVEAAADVVMVAAVAERLLSSAWARYAAQTPGGQGGYA